MAKRNEDQSPPDLVSWRVGADPGPAHQRDLPTVLRPPEPSSGRGSLARRRRRTVLLAVATLAVCAAVAGAWWTRSTDSGRSARAPSAATATTTPATGVVPGTAPPSPSAGADGTTAATSPTATGATGPGGSGTSSVSPARAAEARAVADLRALHEQSLRALSIDGSWVAVLSTKWVGVSDPLLVAANGTHRFLARDILAEHLSLRADDRFSGVTIHLVQSTDFGKRSTHDGKPMWVTVATADFPDAQSVKDFCVSAYPDESGKALEDRCLPLRLSPPH